MSKNLIYCYTSSGNSLNIAFNIAKELGDTDIVMIRKTPEFVSSEGYSTVGFVFPCHGGGLPIGLKEDIKRIYADYSTYIWAVETYSGYKGYALKDLDSIIPLNYWDGISHHCSCIWLLPHQAMFPSLSIKKANSRVESMSKQIAKDIKDRKEAHKPVPSPLINRIERLVWPMIAKKKSKEFTVDDNCISCGICTEICPRGNISMSFGKPVFGSECSQCLSCLQFCPNNAIRIKGDKGREHYHNPNISIEDMTRTVFHID